MRASGKCRLECSQTALRPVILDPSGVEVSLLTVNTTRVLVPYRGALNDSTRSSRTSLCIRGPPLDART